ncbi:MAG TPA: M48 family metallopeptidase [Verrucomicrobiae bacterium]|jgi:Zn-dependent protease with chaperone function|nr:M48 family metallopeptidase [Verrucomicrobiae bacterium]
MDFFERQQKAHRNTKFLVIYFIAGVMGLIAAIYLAVSVIWAGVHLRHSRYYSYNNYNPAQGSFWNPELFIGVTLGTLAVIALGSVSKTMELAQGGLAVANMMGGEQVRPDASDPDERKLLNVVEEMALASGLPVPPVYIMRGERGINAFAAGHSTSDAVVCVTSGCMKLLTRDELQGVIGHEFSHVLNGDMRLNLRMMGIIFGIVCLGVIGRILWQVPMRGRDRNALPFFGLALIAIGGIGVFFGRLIQAAVSRQREFLADASSVQFTRNPAGIVGALKKIGGLAYGSRLNATHANEASHMFFGNGMEESLFGLLDTHPPLEERIRAIDPAFDGKFPTVLTAPEPIEPPVRRAPSLAPPIIAAHSVLPHAGAPTPAHLHYAVQLRNSFPPAVQAAAREPFGASALVYALLLSPDDQLRPSQIEFITSNTSPGIAEEVQRLLPEISEIASRAKLPLVDLALPALVHLSPAQYEEFQAAAEHLIESDGQIELFEYVLQKIILRHLDAQFHGARKQIVQYYSLNGITAYCEVLLSALAYAGQTDPAKVRAAFQQGAAPLNASARAPLNLRAPEQCGLEQVEAALDRLVESVPQLKKVVINACAQTVAADGVIEEAEAELLRAIAETLDCPLPPFVQVEN